MEITNQKSLTKTRSNYLFGNIATLALVHMTSFIRGPRGYLTLSIAATFAWSTKRHIHLFSNCHFAPSFCTFIQDSFGWYITRPRDIITPLPLPRDHPSKKEKKILWQNLLTHIYFCVGNLWLEWYAQIFSDKHKGIYTFIESTSVWALSW